MNGVVVEGVASDKRVFPLLVDASGRPIVYMMGNNAGTPTAVSVDASGRPIVVAQFGSSLLNVSDVIHPRVDTSWASAGSFSVSLGGPPSGEIWKITLIEWNYGGNPAGVTVNADLNDGSGDKIIEYYGTVTIGTIFKLPYELWMKNPDTIVLRFFNVHAADSSTCLMFGHKMKIG